MLALSALVLSIGFADSLNPSTLGPALLYGLSRHARRDVTEFTLAVFVVSTAGGLALLLGPGRLLAALVPKPSPHTIHLLELAAGAAVLLVAGGLWLARAFLARRLAKRHERSTRSALLLGAGIMAVELPTAFPYFAAIAAIVESRVGTLTQVALVLLYNVVFVAPVVALLVLVTVAGRRGAETAAAARSQLQQRAPVVLPTALAFIGILLLAFGGIGLAHR